MFCHFHGGSSGWDMLREREREGEERNELRRLFADQSILIRAQAAVFAENLSQLLFA